MNKKANINSTHQMLNVLDKRLFGYSLAAGAVLAGGDSHAAVQHSGSVTYLIPQGFAPYIVNFTGASLSDYIYNSTFSSAAILGVPGIKNAYVYGGAIPKAFSLSQTIGPSQYFGATSFLNTFFAGAGPKFIGVELTLPGPNIHYGWIQVTVYTVPGQLIVHDWAWEQVPNLPILAGSTVSLAVALTSFTAAVASDAVELAWTTQSEVDNLGFALERCDMDGEGNLLSDWVEIASYLTHPELEGQGNTSEASDYKVTDPNVEVGMFYGYRLIDVDAAGNRQVHNLIQVEVLSTMPEGMVLLQNFPNPFNPTTTIEFSIPEQDNVTLSIYNLKGQTVDVLVNEQMSAGPHHVSWDGSDQPAGVYFYELRTGSHHEIRKLMLVK